MQLNHKLRMLNCTRNSEIRKEKLFCIRKTQYYDVIWYTNCPEGTFHCSLLWYNLKVKFRTILLLSSSINVENKYKDINNKFMRTPINFVTPYMCDSG